MKKTLFYLMILAVVATGCKKDTKSKSLNYSDSDPITIALRDYHTIGVSSDYDLTYSSSDERYVTVSSGGTIYGKNVGNANVTISNGYESKTVTVNVDLFVQPTFDFGCSPSYIRSLYGSPYNSGYIDTILVYQYTANQGYSYACGEMDFFFYDGYYYESDVYIRSTFENPLLMNYLNDNFNLVTSYQDTTMTNYSTHYCQEHGIQNHDTIFMRSIYSYKLDETIICGKQPAFNDWDEICLFYFQVEPEKSAASFLNRRPRSSKFLY